MGSFLKGVSWSGLWVNVVVLALYAAGLFTLGFLLFHKRVKS